ncbi:leukocyte elastase inhibitor-like isoform X1 [Babylonia areolata]|uniref:leukocyte elastase inhibitor-like isoform X1 n=1 Tax=Babylonia areolata TaxID=304850 RepID=UPI003FCF64FD
MNIHCQLILQIIIVGNMASGDLSGVAEVKDMAISNTHFTFDLLRQCGADAKGKNMFFAPYSITTALAMTYLGARNKTAQGMKQALKWSSDIPKNGFGSYLPLLKESSAGQTPGYILVGAQRIYVNAGLSLKPEFSTETQKHFASQAVTAEFATNPDGERETINSWVSEQTRDKIRDLLPAGSMNPLTRMVLVQAMYFKGNWKHKFDALNTKPADFFTPQGTVKVDMMQQTRNFNFGKSSSLDCAAVELPYASNSAGADRHDLSMLILLPDAVDGLEKLEAKLTHDALVQLQHEMHSVKVDLKLPRFSVESSFELKKVLSRLGMGEAFGENADFSGMVDEELYISQVFHKAVVEVNEEGSEAAAATAVVMMARCLPIVMPFVADHPFLFFIVDKRADVILFSGRLANPPTAGSSLLKEDL